MTGLKNIQKFQETARYEVNEDLEYLKRVVNDLKSSEERITGDINSLESEETKIKNSIKGHENRLSSVFQELNEYKEAEIIEKTNNLKSDIDVILVRMEELEINSNKGVDALENSFGVLIDSLGNGSHINSINICDTLKKYKKFSVII
jgi:chromosome segregation ATPase